MNTALCSKHALPTPLISPGENFAISLKTKVSPPEILLWPCSVQEARGRDNDLSLVFTFLVLATKG